MLLYFPGALIITFLPNSLSQSFYPSPTFSPALPVDNDGGGPHVLYAVQAEDLSKVGEQHQRRRLQLQLISAEDRTIRWYVPVNVEGFV